MSKTFFDTQVNGTDYQMTVNGLSVGLNMPDALKTTGEGDDEYAHGLPPYRPRRAYLVDEYPACPDNWMRSSGRIKSYFVPVLQDAGLWLDFNGCDSHANHTAIVVSVQGVNAITGLPCKDAQLEQYRDECPKHKEPYGPDRLCKKCNFKWPKQNYVSSTGTPSGSLWLDGFRADDGKVRQYVFTEQKLRGVAKAIIGEDRVFALGISFFLSKEPRPRVNAQPRSHHMLSNFVGFTSTDLDDAPIGCAGIGDPMDADSGSVTTSWGSSVADGKADDCAGLSFTAGMNTMKSSPPEKYSGSVKKRSLSDKEMSGKISSNVMRSAASFASAGPAIKKVTAVQQMEIAAGARISQHVHDDPNDLEFWQKEPEGLIIINYCSASDALKIINAGKIDLSGSKEGYLQNVPKGNP
jgi:hypothetical protein